MRAGVVAVWARSRAVERGGKRLVVLTREDLDASARAKRPECSACRYDARCEGVWKNYLKRMGWDEFAPVWHDRAR